MIRRKKLTNTYYSITIAKVFLFSIIDLLFKTEQNAERFGLKISAEKTYTETEIET